MNVSQNYSNSSVITSQPDILYNNLTLAGQVIVLFCNGVHLFYLILVIIFKDLRKRPMIFLNHAVFANALYPLASLVFQYVDPTKFTDKIMAQNMCSFFEIYWPFSIFTRMYAILLIAINRYIAVFKIELFKKIKDSNVYIVVSILSIWATAIAFAYISKFAFQTTYSLTFCLHGFSTVWINSLLNGIFYILFSMIFPCIAIIVIYVLIHKKLTTIGKRLSTVNTSKRVSFAPSDQSGRSVNKKREMKFANQFIIMCIIMTLSVCGTSVFGLRGVIPNYFNLFYYWRPVIRCYIMFFSSLIPIFSVYFNPLRKRVYSYFTSTSNAQSSHTADRTK